MGKPVVGIFGMTRREGLVGSLLAMFGARRSTALASNADRLTLPRTLAEALPPRFAPKIADGANGPDIPGLYLSSYLSRHRVLMLDQNGRYRLLLWKIDRVTFERSEAREYAGSYSVSTTDHGDALVVLDFGQHELVNGGDSSAEHLLFMRSAGTQYLLQRHDLNHMAFEIRENGRLGDSDSYFFAASLAMPFADEPFEGRPAPPVDDLPRELAALVVAAPLVMTITAVDEVPDTDGIWENQRVYCTLSLGEEDGLYMNMPVYSTAESGKRLKGHVWVRHPTNCRAGIHYERDAQGSIIELPEIGDALTSKVLG
jgi:hypothetical protein